MFICFHVTNKSKIVFYLALIILDLVGLKNCLTTNLKYVILNTSKEVKKMNFELQKEKLNEMKKGDWFDYWELSRHCGKNAIDIHLEYPYSFTLDTLNFFAKELDMPNFEIKVYTDYDTENGQYEEKEPADVMTIFQNEPRVILWSS